MNVKIYDVDHDGQETFRAQCDLRECFPDDGDKEYHVAIHELEKSGRYWTGGGAAPLVLLMRVQGRAT